MTFESRLDLLRAFDESLHGSSISENEANFSSQDHSEQGELAEESVDELSDLKLQISAGQAAPETLATEIIDQQEPEQKQRHAADLYRDMKPKFDLLDALTDNVIRDLVVQKLQKLAAESA